MMRLKTEANSVLVLKPVFLRNRLQQDNLRY